MAESNYCYQMYSSDYLDVRESDDRERAAVNVVIRHHERASRHRMTRCVFEASKGVWLVDVA
jgi:hypothetical protein